MYIEARVNWQSYFVRDFNLLRDRVPFYIWGKNIHVHRKLRYEEGRRFRRKFRSLVLNTGCLNVRLRMDC